jgi:hypothetical protein
VTVVKCAPFVCVFLIFLVFVLYKTVPLPLVPINCKAPAHNECQEFTLKSDPTNADSAKYKYQMCYLKGTEDVCAILAWQDDINHVIAGLGVNQFTPMYVLYTQCMRKQGQVWHPARCPAGMAVSSKENIGIQLDVQLEGSHLARRMLYSSWMSSLNGPIQQGEHWHPAGCPAEMATSSKENIGI